MTAVGMREGKQMSAPPLHLVTSSWGSYGAGAKVFDGTSAVTIGREGCDVLVDADTTSSRHMATLVPDAGAWWLVVPVAGPGQQAKLDVEVASTVSRASVTVAEGGWTRLEPGDAGTIELPTIAKAKVDWHVEGEPPAGLAEAANRHQESSRTEPVKRRRRRSPEDAEQDRLDALAAAGPTGQTQEPPRLTNRVMDFILTASWFCWDDPQSRMLTSDEVAEVWRGSDRPVKDGPSVDRTLKRGLDTLTSVLGCDPLDWKRDPTRVLAVVRGSGILRPRHRQWLDLDYEVPEDVSAGLRLGRGVGPRSQSDRPYGWRGDT